MLLQLQGYQFKIEYLKSESNISDFINRYPIEDKRQIVENIYEKYVNFVTTTAVPKSLTIDDISKQDKFLQNLHQRIENNDYNLLKKLNFDNETLNLLKWCRKLKDTLKINLDNDIILKDNIIVKMIVSYQNFKTLVKLAHIVHHGIQKTKTLMQSKVFFLRMDSIIENEITNFVPYQATGRSNPPSEVEPTKIPEKVWDTVNIWVL